MKIMEDRIVVGEAVTISWDNVQTLRVLGNKLVIDLSGKQSVELEGLTFSEIDQLFTAYSMHLLTHRPIAMGE